MCNREYDKYQYKAQSVMLNVVDRRVEVSRELKISSKASKNISAK